MTTNEKIFALREAMKKENLTAYLVNTADPHQSEYISDYYRERAWLTGFTGSAGTALLTQDAALLWADGRYFIQAEAQISGSEFKLMKMDTPGVPTLLSWLQDNLKSGDRLGVNDLLVSQAFFENTSNALAERGVQVIAGKSLIDDLWRDRPALPSTPIFHHAIEFTGKSAAEKLQDLREEMKKSRVEATILAGLDDIAWLYNYRGGDVDNNPVALAYSLVTEDQAKLFIDITKVPEELQASLKDQGIEIKDYWSIAEEITKLNVDSVALDKSKIARRLYQALPEKIQVKNQMDIPQELKACLNPVELENQRESYLRDSAVISRFLFWVKKETPTGQLNEWNTAEKLHEMRKSGKHFLDESFTTISAYGSNAAMMHYAPSAEKHAKLEAKSFYLCDSGAQYLDGTTDITRTIAVGPLSEEEITDYTLTVKSHIQLARAIFLEGSTGSHLDVLARLPMWEQFMDYKCGTGHAVGYVLGVHEGPQRISKARHAVPLKLGMVITNEPGVYKANKHGIRLENDYVVQLAGENEGDRYFKFDCLSFVPFDREAIRASDLSPQELNWLNQYHQDCYDKLIDRMETEEEKDALKSACAPIA